MLARRATAARRSRTAGRIRVWRCGPSEGLGERCGRQPIRRPAQAIQARSASGSRSASSAGRAIARSCTQLEQERLDAGRAPAQRVAPGGREVDRSHPDSTRGFRGRRRSVPRVRPVRPRATTGTLRPAPSPPRPGQRAGPARRRAAARAGPGRAPGCPRTRRRAASAAASVKAMIGRSGGPDAVDGDLAEPAHRVLVGGDARRGASSSIRRRERPRRCPSRGRGCDRRARRRRVPGHRATGRA